MGVASLIPSFLSAKWEQPTSEMIVAMKIAAYCTSVPSAKIILLKLNTTTYNLRMLLSDPT